MQTIGFDNSNYIQLQSQKIQERISSFGGKLYVSTTYEKTTIARCDVESAYVKDRGFKDAEIGAKREGLKDKTCYLVLTESGWRFDLRV